MLTKFQSGNLSVLIPETSCSLFVLVTIKVNLNHFSKDLSVHGYWNAFMYEMEIFETLINNFASISKHICNYFPNVSYIGPLFINKL